MSDGEENGRREESDEGEGSYLVAIKRSARRRSVAAGEHVRQRGRYRRFPSKALAREWVRERASPGERIWIQDALPTDRSPADGYLVGGRRSRRPRERSARGTQTTIGLEADIEPAVDANE